MEKSTFLQSFNLEFINSIRSNHALEHATFHVLAGKGVKSTLFGLWVLKIGLHNGSLRPPS